MFAITINIFLTIILAFFSLNCSLDVKKALAPSDPPKVQKSIFSPNQITGHFKTDGLPTVFQWPIYKWNSNKTQLIPMNFSEKVKARKDIASYREERELYVLEFTALERQINLKYENLAESLENNFTDLKCYSYCNTENLFCDPTDEANLFVDDWKIGETEEEASIIAECQQNQDQRENIDDDEDRELNEKVEPLRKKANLAIAALFKTVGARNHFREISSFEFFYGPFDCEHGLGCDRNLELKSENIFLRIQMGDMTLTNFVGNNSERQIYNVNLDVAQGFLVFTTPAFDFENDNEIYGEITYDLEFVVEEGVIRVDGDIRVLESKNGIERIGRFSSAGQISPN